jgi:DNA-binding transcriptional LysR family regulator
MSNNKKFGKINLNHIPVFAAIAETQSLTAAARYLGSDKTRVSRILAEFERALNAQLVLRTTRDVRLTSEGERFYEQCKKILLDWENAANRLSLASDEISGHIRLTAAHGIGSLLLPRAIKAFRQRFPRVSFEVVMTQQTINLVQEGIDIALRIGPLEDSTFKVKRIGECRFIFAATPRFLSSMEPLQRIENLSMATTMAMPHFNRKTLLFKRSGVTVRFKLNSSIVCNSPLVVLDLALQDLGIGLMPELTCRDRLKTGQLVQLFEDWSTETTPISLLFHASTRKNIHVSHFIEFLAAHVQMT